jgi:hypothetical protein
MSKSFTPRTIMTRNKEHEYTFLQVEDPARQRVFSCTSNGPVIFVPRPKANDCLGLSGNCRQSGPVSSLFVNTARAEANVALPLPPLTIHSHLGSAARFRAPQSSAHRS